MRVGLTRGWADLVSHKLYTNPGNSEITTSNHPAFALDFTFP